MVEDAAFFFFLTYFSFVIEVKEANRSIEACARNGHQGLQEVYQKRRNCCCARAASVPNNLKLCAMRDLSGTLQVVTMLSDVRLQ